MAYRFGAKLSLSDEVKRIFNEEAASAVACLGRTDERRRDKNVHEARKSVKKLRALLRLVAPHLPKRVYGRENQQLRNVGRQLSELRDAQAVIEAFAGVSDDLALGSDMTKAATEFLINRKKQLAANVDVIAVMHAAANGVIEAVKPAQARRRSADGFNFLEAGLKRSYKRGRKARSGAKKNDTPEAFHAWRKRVKEHWYHSRLLVDVASNDWNKRIESLKTLEGLLGDDHNLAVLSAIFREHEAFAPVCDKLSEVSRQLRSEAFKVGKSLYKQKWSGVADALSDAHAVWPSLPRKTNVREASGKARSAVA